MLFNSFLRTRRPRRFNYTPRYYDPRKEALGDLVERVKAEKEGKIPTRHEIRFERKHGVHQRQRASNIRLLVIVILLSIVSIIIFY
jgi:hypothetical protein